MTKRRKLLCYGPFCYSKRIKHNREDLITYKHKHYCHRCFKYLKQQHYNRWQLYRFIERKAMVTFPTGIMLRDIKNLRKKHNYTYQGILNSLQYANKHSLKFNFNGQFFLRYVPYVYEDAKKWRYRMDKHNNLNLNITKINNAVNHASVDSKVFQPKKQKHYYDITKF